MIGTRAANALRTSAFLLAAASAFAPPGGRGAAADVTVTLAPDSVSGMRGHVAEMVLRVDMGVTGKSLGSYATTLTWDSTVVRLDSVRAGDFAAPAVNYANAGQVRLTQATSAGTGGVVAIAKLYFRFVSDSTGKRTVIQPTFTELTASDFTNLLPVASVAAAVARTQAPSILVSVSPDSLLGGVGSRPAVNFIGDLTNAGGVALGSWAASITWDSTVIRLDSLRAGDYPLPQMNQPNAGELRLTAADAQGLSGYVSLARLFFHFATDSQKTTPLTIAVTEMHAAKTFADLLPGVTVRHGKIVLGGVLRGDIDNSKSITALDAQLILQGVVGLALPAGAIALPNGDADCNNALKARDAQIVLNQVVGNDVAAFCVGKIQ